jgi:hypothetical protein
MIHPDTEIRFINDHVGYGVVATKLIPKGTITWVQDELDRVYMPQEVQKLSPLMRDYLETYCFMNARGEKVLCWDYAKYVNHSFKPTCFSTAYDFEFALRDIEPGEQLTDDYGYLNLEEPFEAMDEGVDRKIVYPDDIVTYHKEWDEMIRHSLPHIFGQNHQPLLKFMPSATWAQFKNLEHDPSKMVSLLNCHYHPLKAV